MRQLGTKSTRPGPTRVCCMLPCQGSSERCATPEGGARSQSPLNLTQPPPPNLLLSSRTLSQTSKPSARAAYSPARRRPRQHRTRSGSAAGPGARISPDKPSERRGWEARAPPPRESAIQVQPGLTLCVAVRFSRLEEHLRRIGPRNEPDESPGGHPRNGNSSPITPPCLAL